MSSLEEFDDVYDKDYVNEENQTAFRSLVGMRGWTSNKLKRALTSSSVEEAIAANDAIDEMVYIKEVF